MPFLTQTDLTPPLYQEIIDEISRADATIVERAINTGIDEAKGYLSRFDLLKIFGDSQTSPEVDEQYLYTLKAKTKDIIAWELVKLANPNVNIELMRTAYKDAIEWFMKVQSGKVDPAGWPYKADDPTTDFDEGSTIQSSYNPKQTQHF